MGLIELIGIAFGLFLGYKIRKYFKKPNKEQKPKSHEPLYDDRL